MYGYIDVLMYMDVWIYPDIWIYGYMDIYLYLSLSLSIHLYLSLPYLYPRVKEHNNSKRGAKYTRSRRPVTLVMVEEHVSRALAASREARIKSLTRKQKLELIRASGVRSDKTKK